jgi:hypothetical protein
MMAQENIRITSIGHIANQALRRSPSALVTGNTSQGAYLQLSGDFTLYLTSDPFRGPLTINIRDRPGGSFSIQPGDIAFLAEDAIRFSDSQQLIHLQRPLIWKPAPPPRPGKKSPDGHMRIFQQVQTIQPDHPFLPLLKMVITGEPTSIDNLPGIEDRIIRLSRSLQSSNFSDIISEMKLLLGAGPGLTPLGDDLLMGTLLGISRARGQIDLTGDLVHYYHTVISAAGEKTTRLSWSLLSCAIQGSADERIIRVLDGLIAAREIPDHDLENLLDWGSSSGMAVLAGMIMALS